VLFGQQLTYTLAVHNAGPSSTSGVALSDTLPAAATFDSVTSTQGSCFRSGTSVLCSLGTMASGATVTVTIKVTPTAVGTITNSANVLGMTVDPDTADNGTSTDTTVSPVADLSLTKSDSPDPVAAGGLLTYTLGVHNSGPQGATAVTLTDTLPGGVTFESATPTQGTCTEASGTVTCALGTLANGGDAGVEIKVRPLDGGQLSNQASVSSAVADPASANNSATETTTVDPVADLTLTKTDDPDPVLAGEPLTYTLSLHNSGPSSAANVQVTDHLPAGVTFESATPTQGNCSESAGTVECALGTLADEADAGVVIVVRPQAAGTITNEAGAASDAQDPTPGDNAASEDTSVTPAADLSLTKGDDPDPVLEGAPLTYTLTVHNAGPQSATGVQVTDTLPAGVTFDSANPSQGTCGEDTGTVTCDLGTLADEASATVEITVTPAAAGTLTNEASVTSDLADPDSGDRTASTETTVRPVADLGLTKTASPDPVLAGAELTYTLTVDNAGPRDATNTELVDTLPATTTFVSATPSQGSCSHASGTVTCGLGTIADQGSATVEVKVTPQEGGTITNEATVASDAADPAPADNSASAETTVSPAADLELTKTDSPDPVLAGELLTYTLSVHNAGPSSAAAVQLTDTLPAGVPFDSATPAQGTCLESLGIVDCALGTIANGATVNVAIKVRPDTPGTISNQAAVTSLALDGDTADNNAAAETTVEPAADLSLTKSDDPDPVRVDEQLTYTLGVHNAGPQTATSVALTDTLPSGVAFDSVTSTQGTCNEAGGVVECALGDIAGGDDAGVEIKVTPSTAGTITNQASVSSELADPDSADASASVQTTVEPVADLSLTKSDSPDPVLVEELLTYTLSVHNGGPSNATGVSVTDTLPAGTTFGSAVPSQGTCSESSGVVTCGLGALANGADASIEIKVTPNSPGTITNQAEVTSDAHDPATADNSASAATTVQRVADLSISKTDSPDPAVAGEQITYTLTAHNAGPSNAPGTVVTDTLPGGINYESATPSQGTCTHPPGTVNCSLGTLASGADATITIKIRATGAGSLTNQVSITSDASDLSSGNNTASAVTTVTAAAGYPRPIGATPLRVPLVPAFAGCTAPNGFHGPPLASASCRPPATASTYLAIGTPDSNGAPLNSSGAIRLDVILNSNPTPHEVAIGASITDVRCGSGVSTCGNTNLAAGPDYSGQLRLELPVRITDRFNGTGGGLPGTVQDTSIFAPMACTQSSSNQIGSTCSVSTTANALLPGSVISGQRSIWALQGLRVLDGGPDGVASTAGNGVFATQGVLVP
jgi:uncharacterized repeat protein (TIGR01451 family)